MNLRPSSQHLADSWPSISETIDRLRLVEIPTEDVEIVDRMPYTRNPEIVERHNMIIGARYAGFTVREIAEEFGLDKSWVYQILRDARA